MLRSDLAGFGATFDDIRDAVVVLAREGDLAPLSKLVEQYLSALLSNRDLQGFGEVEADRGYVDVLLLRRAWSHRSYIFGDLQGLEVLFALALEAGEQALDLG